MRLAQRGNADNQGTGPHVRLVGFDGENMDPLQASEMVQVGIDISDAYGQRRVAVEIVVGGEPDDVAGSGQRGR